MNFFHLSPAIEALETVLNYGTKVYMFASEIFTVSALLWCLNMLATGIQKTYAAGYAFGKFYRAYLHSYVKLAFVHVIAAVIFVSICFYEGCKVVYRNRHEILPTLNDIRNQIGRQFVYAV